ARSAPHVLAGQARLTGGLGRCADDQRFERLPLAGARAGAAAGARLGTPRATTVRTRPGSGLLPPRSLPPLLLDLPIDGKLLLGQPGLPQSLISPRELVVDVGVLGRGLRGRGELLGGLARRALRQEDLPEQIARVGGVGLRLEHAAQQWERLG